MVPAALGTQTAGSVIRPAAYCGVVGYKPSFGLIETTGVKTLARSFDTVGTFTRSVRDAALLASVLADRPVLASLDGGLVPRVGLYLPPWSASGAPCATDVLHHAAKALRQAGVPVVEVNAIDGFETLLGAQQDVMDWDMVHALLYELIVIPNRIHPNTRSALEMRRSRMSADACDRAHAVLSQLRGELHARMEGLDVLLVPSSPGEAPEGLTSTGSSDFNRGWTALHVPCINLPAGLGPSGMPLGVQLIGRLRDDATLLATAAIIERHLATNRFTAS
jgi:Asp-tRNA(Asn)/Glu-tRNA(Gln) amidotransferase A subunit family amidase